MCLSFIQQRIVTAETALQQAREASNDDTKSSAGDKYETSREMMQQDIDRNNRLLMDAEENLRLLKSLEMGETEQKHIRHGSLVYTDNGNFYLSVSAGHLVANGVDVFAISTASPIGKLMLNKKVDENFSFNSKTYQITAIG